MRWCKEASAHTRRTGEETAAKTAKARKIITVKSEANIRLQIRYAVIYFEKEASQNTNYGNENTLRRQQWLCSNHR